MKTKQAVMVLLMIILLAVAGAQALQINKLNAKATAIATGKFKVVGTGTSEFASDEEMMAAHHGGGAMPASTPAEGIGGCS